MKITTKTQFKVLVAELEKNPALAKGFQRGSTPVDIKAQWDAIANKVNAVGPPKRDSDGWQRVWRDLKFKTKKKLIRNKAESRATRDGIKKQKPLSPLDEAVVKLLHFQQFLKPERIAQRITVNHREETPSTDSSEDKTFAPVDESDDETPSGSPSSQSSCRKRKHDESNQSHCLLSNITSLMNSIKDGVKELTNHNRRMYELESKKVQLMERAEQRKKEQYAINMELKKLKLQIQQKE